jgi:hypothetical protein
MALRLLREVNVPAMTNQRQEVNVPAMTSQRREAKTSAMTTPCVYKDQPRQEKRKTGEKEGFTPSSSPSPSREKG